MAVRVDCPHCGAPCQLADEHQGRPVRCYRCNQVFSFLRAAAPTTAVKPPLTPTPLPPGERGGNVASPLPSGERGRGEGPSRLDIGCASSRGRVRDRNEDSCLVQHLRWMSLDDWHEAALLVVADGMGGYQAGDRASRMVIQTVGSVMMPLLTAALLAQSWDDAEAAEVERAIREANDEVHAHAVADPACKGMGATLALVLVRDAQVFIGHVGDCRVYHQRGGQLTQVTRDQTLVARMVELGQVSPQRALTHPARNEVTQAVGKRAEIEPAHYRLELAPGDRLLINCDGLTAHVEAADLEKILSGPVSSAQQLARRLVELTDERGGSDNCTVIAVCC